MVAKKAVLAAAMAAILVGCGGGDSDDPTLEPSTQPPVPDPEPVKRLFSNGDLSVENSLGNEIPVGVYQYTSVNPEGGGETIGLALVSDTGRVALALPSRLSFARIELGENDRFENRLEDSENPDAQSLSITGRRDAGVAEGQNPRISGTFLDNELQTVTRNYRLDLQDADGDTFSFADLEGTYSGINSEGVGTVYTIDNSGNLTGAGTSGCDYEGTVRIPDSGQEVFELNYAASNCGPTSEFNPGDRDGEFFGLGRTENSNRSITIFGTNGTIGTRVSGDSTANEDQVLDEEIGPFVSNEFDVEPSITAKLEPGVYEYTDIPLGSTPPPTIESGVMLISDTGRLALATDVRLGTSRVRVNDVDTFLNTINQVQSPGSNVAPSLARGLFGTPNNNGGGDFTISGSLLDQENELINRYEAVRDTSNDAALSATPLTITRLSGTYSGTRNPGAITATITVSASGAVTGSDTTGCVYNGEANVNNGESGVFEMRLNVRNCSASTEATGDERNGTYNAVGNIIPGTPDQMQVVLGSTENVEFLQLTLQ